VRGFARMTENTRSRWKQNLSDGIDTQLAQDAR
jgi:hypothetical protein